MLKKLIPVQIFFIFFSFGCLEIQGPTQQVKQPTRSSLSISNKEFFPNNLRLNQVFSVLTELGSIYVGTSDGIYSFSLPDFKPQREKKPYLSGHKITGLALGDSAHLFAISEKKGLFVLYPGENDFQHTGSTMVRDMAIPKGSNLVYCATSHGVDIYEDGKWTNIKIQSLSDYSARPNDIQSIAHQGGEVFWLGTSFGVYRMERSTKFDFLFADFQIIQGSSVVNKKGNSPLGGNLFYDIYPEPDGKTILFATNGGVSILKKPLQFNTRTHWKTYTGNHTISRMTDEGVKEIPIRGNSSIPSNFVKNAVKLGESLYFGTEEGLVRLKDQVWTVYNLENQFPGDRIYDLHPVNTIDEHILYVGTSGGLAVIREKKHEGQEDRTI